MDWLRQVLAQAGAAFRTMTAAQRASMVMLGLTIAVALVLVAALGSREKYAVLVSRLDQSEMGELTAYLDQRGEKYKVDQARGAVLVPTDRQPSLGRQVAAENVVAPQKLFDELAYIDRAGKLGISERERSELMRIALASELEKTIRGIEGVERATVHIRQEARSDFDLSPEKVGVSVTVSTRRSRPMDQQLANAIIDLANCAVRNSDPKLIKVVDNRTHRTYVREDDETFLSDGKNMLALAAALERHYRQKIEEFIGGTGYDFTADVNCKFDLQKTREIISKFDPENQVIIYQRSRKRDETGAVEPGGKVLLEGASGAGMLPSGAVAGGTPSRTTDVEKEERSAVGTIYQEILHAPYKVMELRAAVWLHDRVVQKKDEQNGRIIEQYAPPGEKELVEWKAQLANLLGVDLKDEKQKDWIYLSHMAPRRVAPDTQLLAARGAREIVGEYAPYLRVAGVFLLAVFALFCLYGLGRRAAAPLPHRPTAPGGPEVPEVRLDEVGPEPEEAKFRQMQGRIRQLVEQDSRKAATLVRRWLAREP